MGEGRASSRPDHYGNCVMTLAMRILHTARRPIAVQISPDLPKSGRNSGATGALFFGSLVNVLIAPLRLGGDLESGPGKRTLKGPDHRDQGSMPCGVVPSRQVIPGTTRFNACLLHDK